MNKPLLYLAAACASCIFAGCGGDDAPDSFNAIENKHLQGNYDLQKYYVQRAGADLFYVVPSGTNGRLDGGAFGWDVELICIRQPDQVYVYISTAGDVVQNGAYSLNTDTGQVEGPLPDAESYPWIPARQFYFNNL